MRLFHQLVILLIAYVVVTLIFYTFLVNTAFSHDIYMGLHEKMDPDKMLCCGGDEKTGDCEAVTYHIYPDGNVLFESRRYGKSVLVAKDKIGWYAIPGGSHSEAHWCGKPGNFTHTDPQQIDPEFVTYCAFIASGGV